MFVVWLNCIHVIRCFFKICAAVEKNNNNNDNVNDNDIDDYSVNTEIYFFCPVLKQIECHCFCNKERICISWISLLFTLIVVCDVYLNTVHNEYGMIPNEYFNDKPSEKFVVCHFPLLVVVILLIFFICHS